MQLQTLPCLECFFTGKRSRKEKGFLLPQSAHGLLSRGHLIACDSDMHSRFRMMSAEASQMEPLPVKVTSEHMVPQGSKTQA